MLPNKKFSCAGPKAFPVFLWFNKELRCHCRISIWCCPLSHGGWRSGLSCFKKSTTNQRFPATAQAVRLKSNQSARPLPFFYNYYISPFGSLITLEWLKSSRVSCLSVICRLSFRGQQRPSVRREYVGQVRCVADPWTDWSPLPNS